MKKYLKIFLIGLCIVIFSVVAYFTYDLFKNPYVYDGPADRSFIKKELAIGPSMSPTISNGQMVYAYDKKPVIGDIVSFDCPKKCEGGKNETGTTFLIKRLIKIDENDCWWVEGDNKEHSWDSRYFGWLCPLDRKLIGVVKLD